jgi:hypothetical protein
MFKMPGVFESVEMSSVMVFVVAFDGGPIVTFAGE